MKITKKLINTEYKKIYGNEYKNREDYKLTICAIKIFPYLKKAEGCPNYLMSDLFEFFCETLSDFDFTYKIELEKLINFVELTIKNGYADGYIHDILFAIKCVNNSENYEKICESYKPLTKIFLKEHKM